HARRTDHAAGAADILDHDLLTQHFGQPLGDNPPEQVRATARGKRNHHRYRPLGPALRGGRRTALAEPCGYQECEQHGWFHDLSLSARPFSGWSSIGSWPDGCHVHRVVAPARPSDGRDKRGRYGVTS